MSNQGTGSAAHGLPASKWVKFFRDVGVEADRLDGAKSALGQATIVGTFLSRLVDREVRIDVDGRSGKATLRAASRSGGKTLYWFEVAFDGQSSTDDRPDDEPRPVAEKTFASGKRPPKERKKPEAESRDNPIDHSPAPGVVAVGNDEQW